MTGAALAILFTLAIWWVGTGVVLMLDGLPRRTFRWTLLGASALLAAALGGLAATRTDTSSAGAYLAFTFALVVWGWLEITFLTGFLTGPRKTACPAGCSGWPHFVHAVQAILWHELAIVVAAVVVVLMTWGQPNPVGGWTVLMLWGMRQSAKLNLFLGVRNLSEEFLPHHLRYLRSYFTQKPLNLLFPFSVTAATVVTACLVQQALAAASGTFEQVAYTLIAALAALGVLEHWFLIVPLPVTALWKWGLGSRQSARGAAGAAEPIRIDPPDDCKRAPIRGKLA
jgi:putative photosynthetic complex assembly protein 2